MTITEFLTARLDEDEAIARRNIGKVPGGQHGLGDDEQYGPSYPDYQTYNDDDTDAADAYISRFRPLRALREIEHKRAVLALHKPNSKLMDQWTRCYHCNDSNGDYRAYPCDDIRLLAAIWNDHPDYDPAWAVKEVSGK